SEEQRAQQISAELGLSQSLRGRGECVPAQFVLQPDRPGGRARLLDRGRHQALRQEPWPHGAGMMNTAKLICTIVLTCSASLAHAQGDAARGEKKFEDCASCHSLTAGGKSSGRAPPAPR